MNGYNISNSGVVTADQFRVLSGGSQSAPVIGLNGDSNSGIYFGGDSIYFSTNGTWKFGANNSGVTVNSLLQTNGNTIDTEGGSLNLGGGVISEVNELYADVGSVSDPSYTFDGDTNTGIYRYSAGTVAVASDSTVGGLFGPSASWLRGAWQTASTAGYYARVINSNGKMAYHSSSLRVKKDIEDLELDRAYDIVERAKPIFYRSDTKVDSKTDSFYGFGAEPLAEVDPRLVSWTIADDCDCDLDAMDADHDFDEDESLPSSYPHNHACRVPGSVEYGMMTAPLVKVVDDLVNRIKTLEAQLAS